MIVVVTVVKGNDSKSNVFGILLLLPPLSYYCATKHFATGTNFPGVVELTTQLQSV